MVRFHGPIGYGETVETKPGVWVEQITERTYFGDVVRTSRQAREGENTVNDDISINNSISIVADAFAHQRFFAIRYVKWAGTYWTVSNVDVVSPRLILALGGVYNGPKPASSDASDSVANSGS